MVQRYRKVMLIYIIIIIPHFKSESTLYPTILKHISKLRLNKLTLSGLIILKANLSIGTSTHRIDGIVLFDCNNKPMTILDLCAGRYIFRKPSELLLFRRVSNCNPVFYPGELYLNSPKYHQIFYRQLCFSMTLCFDESKIFF